MFELSVACKYLIPRWRQLSVSIISLVSMLVIALVVWLIVVFFSVKDGLENSWIDKLIALTAPIRITPTEKYYASYYYQIDSISSQTDFTHKTLGEKLHAKKTNPYDPTVDEEAPAYWTRPDLNQNGQLKDLVKSAHQLVLNLPEMQESIITDYEMTAANLKLRMIRPHLEPGRSGIQVGQTQQFLEQAAYVGSFDPDTAAIAKTLLPISASDFQNLIHMQAVSPDNIQEESSQEVHHLEASVFQSRLRQLFDGVTVTRLQTPLQGWRLPVVLYPSNALFAAIAVLKDDHVNRVILPTATKDIASLVARLKAEGFETSPAEIHFNNNELSLILPEKTHIKPISPWIPLKLEGNIPLAASLLPASLDKATSPADILFQVQLDIQGQQLSGNIPLGQLNISQIAVNDQATSFPFAKVAIKGSGISLPADSQTGEGILVPRSYKEGGALVGDQGYISYYSPTPSSIQEQRLPVYIAGFYDPGIMPIGGKFILASRQLTALIRASHNHDDALLSNGFNVRFKNLSDAPKIKSALLQAFKKEGLDKYWNIQTYQEYDFTKDLIQQLHSEKNLFSLISMVIIIVACSNIISMLIILVNDKKVEIGILRSMGATSGSIAAIFGLCGMVMGALGSIIGICAAILTLNHLEFLVGMISRFQGYDLFNPVFYGNTLPNEISMEVLGYVVLATALISLLAGIVPAVKASLLRPSAILRSE